MPPSDTVKPHPPAPERGAPPASGRRTRRGLLGCASTLLLLALLWPARALLLTALASYLSVGQRPVHADVIFIFGGDPEARPFAAADLYRRGYATRLVVPSMQVGMLSQMGLVPSNNELFLRILHREGVPDSAIVIAPSNAIGSGSTRGDVRALRAWATAHRVRRVLAITSFWHTRRARLDLRRGLAGSGVQVTVYGAPSGGFHENNWWKSENGLLTYFEEYLKLVRDALGVGDDG